MPLVVAPLNTAMSVIKILTDDKTKKHLESLGITIGSELCVLSSVAGNIICVIKDGRLALDRNLATKILVEPKKVEA